MMDFDTVAVSCVLFYTKMFTKIEMCYEKIYQTNEIVRKLEWMIQYIYSTCKSQRVEPYDNKWISKSILLPQRDFITGSYTLVENYSVDYKDIFFKYLQNSHQSFDEIYKNYFTYYNEYPNHCGELIIVKTEYNDIPCYLTNDTNIEKIEPQQSSIKLLTVLYEHPAMPEGIELNLSREWFYVGNRLFSPVFVFRLLKYQSKQFVFDNNYKVSFMDSDFASVELKSNSHIVLTEDSYEIITEDFSISDLENISYDSIYDKGMKLFIILGCMRSMYFFIGTCLAYSAFWYFTMSKTSNRVEL
jgi:hypothetical protein